MHSFLHSAQPFLPSQIPKTSPTCLDKSLVHPHRIQTVSNKHRQFNSNISCGLVPPTLNSFTKRMRRLPEVNGRLQTNHNTLPVNKRGNTVSRQSVTMTTVASKVPFKDLILLLEKIDKKSGTEEKKKILNGFISSWRNVHQKLHGDATTVGSVRFSARPAVLLNLDDQRYPVSCCLH